MTALKIKPEYAALIGKVPNEQIAQLAGCTRSSVVNFAKRMKLKSYLPPGGQGSKLTMGILLQLGTKSDVDIAIEHGVSFSTVWQWRKKYRISAYREPKARKFEVSE